MSKKFPPLAALLRRLGRTVRRLPSWPEPVVKLARQTDTNRVPPGASSLFAKYIHPAFRGTSVAFHTLRLLARGRQATRQNTTGEPQPYTHGAEIAALAKGILGGRRTTPTPFGTEKSPFGKVGEWFKKLRSVGVSSIPEHLNDLGDRYNWQTADRRHALDREVYDLIHDTHGQGDYERTDHKIRAIGSKMRVAPEEHKRALTASVRQALAKRIKGHELPADWHTELLNSIDRLHQYSLDRQMLKDDAQERRRQRITGPAPASDRKSNVGWKQWFMGATGLGHKKQDPLRLSREAVEAMTPQMTTHPDRGPVLADALEESDMHHDQETLDHLRTVGDGRLNVYRHPTTGKVFARKIGHRKAPDWFHEPAHPRQLSETTVIHEVHGPGGHYVVTHHHNEPLPGVDSRWNHFHDIRRWDHPEGRGEDTYPIIASGADQEAWLGRHLDHDYSDRDARIARANELAARWEQPERHGEEPVRLSRLAASSSLGNALRELASRNQQARELAARRLLRESGEPGTVASVLAHHPERGFRPSVLAALTADDSYAKEAARYLGAWHGSLMQEPETVAFHAHPEGADRLHVLKTTAAPEHVTGLLNRVGVNRFALRPSPTGSTVFVYDRGALLDLTPVARSLPNGNVVHTAGTGQRLGQGAGTATDSGSSAPAYREHIRAVEDSVSGGSGTEAQRVHLARLKPGAVRAKELKVHSAVLGAGPEDIVRRSALADHLTERGQHHDEAANVNLLMNHPGPVHIVRHPKAQRAVIVPGHPRTDDGAFIALIHRGRGGMTPYSHLTRPTIEYVHGPRGIARITEAGLGFRNNQYPHLVEHYDHEGQPVTPQGRTGAYALATDLADARRIAHEHAFGD